MSAPDAARPALSVVSTLYRSEPYLEEFYRRMVSAAEGLDASFEIVLVDDGSPDRAAHQARGLVERDPRVVLVELSRNFGHHQAIVAGLSQARGERVFIIDCDLEEQPEWLGPFAAEMERSGADVVFGINTVRKGAWARRWLGGLFWRLFNALSEIRVPPNPCTVRLVSRRYVDALLPLPDRNLFLAGNFAWLGFDQRGLPVEKDQRRTRSSYTPARLAGLFLDAITSFTSYPLRLIFECGVVVASISVLAGAALLAYKLARPEAISLGWPSLILSIWFLSGVIIAFLGVIGIYLSKVFNETKGRPLYIVRAVRRGNRPEEPA